MVYIYLHEWFIFYGFHVGRYTRYMDPMGIIYFCLVGFSANPPGVPQLVGNLGLLGEFFFRKNPENPLVGQPSCDISFGGFVFLFGTIPRYWFFRREEQKQIEVQLL